MFVSAQAQKINLSLNLDKGNDYRHVTHSRATVLQEIQGQKMVMIMTVKGGMVYTVVSENSEYYDMDVMYEHLSLIMDMPQGLMEFGSEKHDEDDIFSSILARMIGIPFRVQMARSGKIIDVQGVESIIDAVFDEFSSIPEDVMDPLREQLLNAYGADAFRGSLEMVTAIFPEEPVRIGEKWTIQTKLESGIPMSVSTEFELKDVNPTHVRIVGHSFLETDNKNAYFQLEGMPVRYNLKGTMTTNIQVDPETGWVIQADVLQEVSGVALIQKNPQLPDGMRMPITLLTETTTTGN